MELAGVLCGLAAAFAQSLSFLLSRQFVIRQNNAVFRLLVLSHVIMGVASLAILPLVWTASVPPVGRFFWPLAGSAGFYMLGQLGLFFALRYTDASRTAPLLGLKIVVIALITVTLMRKAIGPQQWLAVAMSVGAAFVLHTSGRRMHWQAVAAVLATCVNYSLSDLSIVELVKALGGPGDWHVLLLSVSLSYILCGIVAAILMPWLGRSSAAEWRYALPFSAAWYVAMIFLYACFGLIGALYGNIVQSTRGLISVIIGAALARLGMVHLERRVSRWVFLQRAAAAVLMSAAIALFWLGKR